MGRRVNLLSPEDSLLLSKPLMKVPHGGGKQLSPSDACYDILKNWVAQGCSTAEPKIACTGIRIEPEGSILLSPSSSQQQLRVLGIFADGSKVDVTHLASFSSSDLSVVTVDGQGMAKGIGRGQAGISARFLEHWSTLFVTYSPSAVERQAARRVSNNPIDKLVDEQLARLHIEPAQLCSDEQFVRRVHLDVTGLLPTIDKVQLFLADRDSEKRAKLVDALLERPEYAHFWALKWGDLLRINNEQLGATGVQKYSRWLVRSFADNMPYDEFVNRLLLSKGSTFENPPANYFRTSTDLNTTIESAAQVFMGVRLECCKCHNHHHERWTQDNYYGFAAFFNRVQRKPNRRTGDTVIFVADQGEVVHPRTNRPMRPWLPDIGPIEEQPGHDRRTSFVHWLTAKDNQFLSAVEANRIWFHLMGRGIVEPVDDFRDSNPPSNPMLLAALARYFREHGFDRKQLMRLILTSLTYQSTSVAHAGNQDDDKYFSHYRSRLLTAEQLLDAIGAFTEQPDRFRGLPESTRATQLPSPDVGSEFLEVFGQPKRNSVCQCDRVTEVTLSQALQIANGQLVHDKLSASDGRLQRLLSSNLGIDQMVDELYQAAYSRRPTEKECQVIATYFQNQPARERALQDFAWALINSNEFMTQH